MAQIVLGSASLWLFTRKPPIATSQAGYGRYELTGLCPSRELLTPQP